MDSKAFVLAAEEEGITWNMDKFQFFLKKMFMLVHNVSAGSKPPKPERLRALMEYQFSDNSKAFRRLIGFFAYNVKLTPQYSSRL